MYEFYAGLFVSCVGVFSCGFLFGAAWATGRAERTARTKIAIAENNSEEWRERSRGWERRYYEIEKELGQARIKLHDAWAERVLLRNELANRPMPRQRDANGRFVK